MCAPSPLAQALGIYVDIVSIDLLFASADKFNSGTPPKRADDGSYCVIRRNLSVGSSARRS
jgi:peptide methionine sulfoxide reductase MsrB